MKNKSKLILGLISFCLILSFIITFTIMKFGTGTYSQVSLMSFSSNTSSRLKNTYKYFSGTNTKNISLKKGEILNVSYKSTVKKGSLKILVLNAQGDTIKTLVSNTSSIETINAEKDEKLKIRVEGHSTSGSYDISWTTD